MTAVSVSSNNQYHKTMLSRYSFWLLRHRKIARNKQPCIKHQPANIQYLNSLI